MLDRHPFRGLYIPLIEGPDFPWERPPHEWETDWTGVPQFWRRSDSGLFLPYHCAITIIGTAQSGAGTNGNDVTLTFDGTPAEGDMVLLLGGYYWGAGPEQAHGPVTAGYTEIIASGSGAAIKLGAWYKFMTSTPDTTVVGNNNGHSQNAAVYASYMLRGVDATTPVDVAGTDTGEQTSDGTHVVDSPSITPVTNGAWVFSFGAHGHSQTITAQPTNYTGFATQMATDTNPYTAGFSYRELATAAPENPGPYTQNNPIGNTRLWRAMTIAIRPDGGAGAQTVEPGVSATAWTAAAPTISVGAVAVDVDPAATVWTAPAVTLQLVDVWSHVQGLDDELQLGSATTRVRDFPGDVTAGDLLLAIVTWVGATTASVAGGGLTWNSTPSIENVITTNQHTQLFWAIATTSEAVQVTATFSGASTVRGLALEEFKHSAGALSESDFSDDAQNAQATPGTGTDAVTSGNITIADDGSLLYGFLQTDEGDDIGSAGSGFVFTGTNFTLTATPFAYGEWDTVDAGTDQATFTLSTGDQTVVVAIAFSPPGGAQTVEVTPATTTWTAAAPTISVGAVTAQVDPATTTWTATAPTVAAGAITAQVDPATTSWSAQAPVIAATLTVDVTPSTTTWAATAPTITAAVTVTPGFAATAWTATAPTITQGTAVNVTPATTTWTATAPTFALSVTIQIDPAATTWTATAATVTAGAVTAQIDPATTTWLATDLTTTQTLTVSIDPAATTWLATAPTIVAGGVTASVDPATTTWTAPATTTAQGTVVQVDPAATTWLATAPTLVAGAITAQIDPAATAWSAAAPTVQAAVTVTVDPASTTWSAPDLTIDQAGAQTVEPGVAATAWTATALTTTQGGVTASVDPATTVWTAPAAVAAATLTVSVDPATTTWSAPDATIDVTQVVAVTPAATTWSAPAPTIAGGAILILVTPAVTVWTAPALSAASSLGSVFRAVGSVAHTMHIQLAVAHTMAAVELEVD